MEIKGVIREVLPEQGGTSAKGNQWRKQGYVLETEEQYPKKVYYTLFNDRVDQFRMDVGSRVVVSIDIESREFNGRWYTDINAWKVEKDEPQQPAQQYAGLEQLPGMVDPKTIKRELFDASEEPPF